MVAPSGTIAAAMSDPVHRQYEALPYPPRDPREEAKRLIIGSPSELNELNHFVFAGGRNFRRPFRALVAGGGTGDASIMLGAQLVAAGAREAEIVHLDWSEASCRIAAARAAARKLSNIRVVNQTLVDLPHLGLGQFDYIDCCGVLHHLEDPAGGLRLLVDALAPDGGMGVMVYGALGRTGVYPVQDVLRRLVAPSDDVQARVALARKLLAQLPATNWLKRNPFIADHLTQGDPGLFDLLLHARDRAYGVAEIAALVEGAGLRLVGFVPPARYEPASYLSDAGLLKRLSGLDPLARAGIAEALAGNLKAHVFYAVKKANPVAPPRPDRRDLVPVLSDLSADALARGLKPSGVLSIDADGLTLRLPLPRLAPAIAGLIDGRRTLAEIEKALKLRVATLAPEEFLAEFARLYDALHGAGKLFLRANPAD